MGIKKNFIAKLSANFLNIFVNGLIGLFLPRLMGPHTYGTYGFLSNFFRNIIQFFDLFISPGFYVIYNKKKQKSLVAFAHYYIFIFFLLNIILILLVNSNSTLSSVIFKESKPLEIVLMSVLAFFNWTILLYANIFDSENSTVFFEKNRIISKCFFFFFFLVIFWTNNFSIVFVILIFILSNLFLISISFRELFRPVLFYWQHVLSIFIKSLKTLTLYNAPLIAYSVCAVIILQSEIIMINYFYGSEEMSYLAFSYQIGTLIFVFSSSLTPLIIKKYVDDVKLNNFSSIGKSFSNEVSYLFYLIGFFSIFLFVHAEDAIKLIAGAEYLPGLYTFKLYSLYPMHQTLGQISSAFFFASNRVKVYSRVNITIAIIFAFLSAYFLLPINHGGAEMGSKGLVIKMLLSQIFSVYILLFVIYKSLSKNYRHLIFNHIKVIGLFLFVGSLLELGLNESITNEILSVIINFVLYTVICLLLLFSFNSFFALPNNSFKRTINFVKSAFHD